jgi:hypothetical protein
MHCTDWKSVHRTDEVWYKCPHGFFLGATQDIFPGRTEAYTKTKEWTVCALGQHMHQMPSVFK